MSKTVFANSSRVVGVVLAASLSREGRILPLVTAALHP
jgi:hypothetical protein